MPAGHQFVVAPLHLRHLDFFDLVTEQTLMAERVAHAARTLAVERVAWRRLERGGAVDGMCRERIAVVDMPVDRRPEHLARGRRAQIELGYALLSISVIGPSVSCAWPMRPEGSVNRNCSTTPKARR